VEVSGDLQHAKIFVSIYGTDEARAETMAGLKAVTGSVRHTLGQRIRLRRTPEVTFIEDRGIERGMRVISLLDELKQEWKDREETPEQNGIGLDDAIEPVPQLDEPIPQLDLED